MSKLEIEQIWNKQQLLENERKLFSVEEIRYFKSNFSSDITLSKKRSLVFDSFYKGIVIGGYTLLIFLGGITLLKVSIAIFIIVTGILSIIRNMRLKRKIHNLDTSKDLLSVLKEKYGFLTQLNVEFLITSSLTNPFFVFGGFQFYQLFKYHQDRLIPLLSDPVTYIFLFMAFLVPYLTQKAVYKNELKDLEQIMDIDLDEVTQEVSVIRIHTRKRKRTIVWTLLMLIGMLALLIIIQLAI